ncbi:MAG: hypothetical protein HY648_10290 [Acidobacteria bacterium]|nr:hypothetical protein [Acidobacteriota bacterium]
MTNLYRMILGASWSLGVLCLIAAVALELVPGWRDVVHIDSRGMLIAASALFLCTLATREIQRTQPPIA